MEQAQNTTSIRDEKGDRSFASDSNNRNKRNVHNATAFYDLKLDALGSKLSISANMMINNSNANNYYNTITSTKLPLSLILSANIKSIRAGRFGKEFFQNKTESGIKFTKIKNDSEFNFYDILNGQNVFNTKEVTISFIMKRIMPLIFQRVLKSMINGMPKQDCVMNIRT